ncbi:hypothetical protein SERLA73DRAFT_175829 [Serpula lacrymans var. lacrymans S7.3]|uniref:Uncharacterized protein n=2 Tax=Serpula lacrymans var. lacrymans TaxID=341189 RepID=F8PIY3_SERL3|nr:uncharacterized protein SERLADRAFT_458439 [Serpula lacrymans var. lacrymans S7.9]EGO04083.1 hypothetical protein SERLA73DRAFT_175829 [Serpula lacrymans var. lacrymans S7.3]EGO30003.1 hypothetical protein SERLADRAFT_458439 [Serpula lacrymans var. lacrymans S7.9]
MVSASSHHALAVGIIIGAVIGGVLLVAALAFILFRCHRKHASRAPTSHNRHHSNSFGSNMLTLSNIPGLGHVSEGNYAILSDPPMSSYGPPSPIPQIQRAPSPLTPELVPASRGHKSLNVGVNPGVESKRTSARTHRSYTTRSLDNSDESHLTLPAYFSELGFRL